MPKKIRTTLSAAGVLALAVTAVAPASAAPPQKTEATWATEEISHVGELEGFPGTSQLIGFSGNTAGFSDVTVVGFDCPAGQLPSWEPESGREVGEIELTGTTDIIDYVKKSYKN